MVPKLFIEDLPIKNKKILMRVDFNVPLDGDGYVTDATRLEASLPSMNYVLSQGGALILMSHLGRPQNAPTPALSLSHILAPLQTILNRKVTLAPDCVGPAVEKLAQSLQPGQVLLLENLRFHRAETHPEESPEFAEALARLGDLYVNDAFGTAHREHSSTYTITTYFAGKAAAGYLLEKEARFLGQVLESPKHPFIALLGGAKISTKMGVLHSLLKKVDTLLIGGGMAYTFLKAKGLQIGNSIYEEDFIELAKEILARYGTKVVLPTDFVCAKACSEDATTKIFNIQNGIAADFQGLDIGPATRENFKKILQTAKTVLWNGPLGVYELKPFAQGTEEIGRFCGQLKATTLAGGGDLLAALNQVGVAKSFSHLSTGGGATLEFIEYGTLPGIEALSDKPLVKKG